MKPIQPYQPGLPTNQQGQALQAMLAGRTLYGQNPMDEKRKHGLLLQFMLGKPSQ